MSLRNPYQAYQHNTVNTASPGELTLMLYNGLIKFIKQAKQALNDQEIEAKNTNLTKAQAIVRELMISLDQNVPVSENMLQMYDYMNRRLIDANVKNDVSILDEVESYAIEFRDTWKQVVQQIRKQQHGQGGRV